ncbi:unnamed protein product [Dracunculus medinensis]|uniref:Forkhead box protein O n=1 Tax=Dracunculus medinensis TaxID=318479 RepID=A0A0N4UM97_DRAME|nr:unnamed protein product [Dracunculus medinensis]
MECDDIGPISRDRCNTWPLRRPQIDINPQTSPLIHERIPEEENDIYGSSENMSNSRLCSNVTVGMVASSGSNSGQLSAPNVDSSDTGSGISGSKKSTTRRNAWGNMSYADLITQAILSSPDKRLTLSQVYEWMVQNVPYFRDKGDSNSSAGWKNSIRHNLSLHSRFTRLQNEGAGKSSWWVINPDAKPGRSPRRPRSIMVISSQFFIFRPRELSRNLTPSTLSIPVSQSENFDDYEFPQFLDSGHIPSDLVDRTRQVMAVFS